MPPGAAERTTPDFWQYLESLKVPDWDKHILYLYRVEPSPSIPLGKFAGTIATASGQHVSWGDREEAELALAEKYGGGTFRAILKRGAERITQERIYIGGQARPLTPFVESVAADAGVSPMMSDASATARVASQAMSTIAGQEKLGMQVGMDALVTAANVIKGFTADRPAPTPPPASETDQLLKAVMVRMLERAMNPADPIETLGKLLEITRNLGVTANPAAATNPLVENILKTAVERLMAPPPATGALSTGTELVRQLPAVANYVSQALSDWRGGMEAQRDAEAIRHRAPVRTPPAPQTLPPARNQQPPQVVAPPPAPANPANGIPTGPSLEFVEQKVVEIIKEPISADEAADRVLSFLGELDPQLISQLVSLGEVGMVHLFNTRAMLKPLQSNPPRVLEFIRAFLKQVAEDEAAEQAAATQKPN